MTTSLKPVAGILMQEHVLSVINDKGRPFNVVLEDPDNEFGPIAVFFDATDYGPRATCGPHGQRVSSYYVKTLLGLRHDGSAPSGGLDLHGGVDSWKLDAEAMRVVRSWLRLTTERLSIVRYYDGIRAERSETVA